MEKWTQFRLRIGGIQIFLRNKTHLKKSPPIQTGSEKSPPNFIGYDFWSYMCFVYGRTKNKKIGHPSQFEPGLGEK